MHCFILNAACFFSPAQGVETMVDRIVHSHLFFYLSGQIYYLSIQIKICQDEFIACQDNFLIPPARLKSVRMNIQSIQTD